MQVVVGYMSMLHAIAQVHEPGTHGATHMGGLNKSATVYQLLGGLQ